MSFLNKFFLTLIIVGFTSCIGDVDFDQVNDFEATPAYKFSLANFEFDEVELDALNVDDGHIPDDFIVLPSIDDRNWEKVVFEFEGVNTFDDPFFILITLLDETGTPTYTFDTITVTANSTEADEIQSQEVDLFANPEVLNSRIVRGELVYNGTITTSDPGILSFKSAGTFYLGL